MDIQMDDGKAVLIHRRPTPPSGGGAERWKAMALLLHDCNTVLTSGIGPYPLAILEASGIYVVVMEGLAKEGVEATLTGKAIPKILCAKLAIAALASFAAGAAWVADNQRYKKTN